MNESAQKENCILEALPGTAKHICKTCNLPQATVSKLLAKLILRNRAFHAGWVKPDGAMASMVYARGPKPEGYTPPARPRSARTKEPAPRTPKRSPWNPAPIRAPATPDVAAWDAELSTAHLFRTEPAPRELPPLPALLAVWMTPVSRETCEPSDERLPDEPENP